MIDLSEISVGKADDSGGEGCEAMIDSSEFHDSEIAVGKADDSGVEAMIDLSELKELSL